MSAFYQNYLARNEVTTSVDTSVPVIELGHTSSLLRPLSIGSNWNRIAIYFRCALSGSPATGNLTGTYFFAGLCSGNKRFSQNLGGSIGTHAIGLASNSTTSSDDWTGTTSTLTDPASRNYYQVAIGRGIVAATGSIYYVGSSFDRLPMPRYETIWTSSLPTATVLNNAFLPFGLIIEKPGVNTNAVHTTWRIVQMTWQVVATAPTASINVPASSVTLDRLMVNNTEGQFVAGFMADLIVQTFPGVVGGNFCDYDGANTTANPDTASYGDFDTFNVYYSSTGYPQSKLLIKDIFVIRMC
jgi:hypothetical protein